MTKAKLVSRTELVTEKVKKGLSNDPEVRRRQIFPSTKSSVVLKKFRQANKIFLKSFHFRVESQNL